MRRFKAWWYKPFVYVGPNESLGRPLVPDALVVLSKEEYEVGLCRHEDRRGWHEVVTRYSYYLLLDLWVVKINMVWRGKDRGNSSELEKGEACKRLRPRQTR